MEEDLLENQISPSVKYRQTPKNTTNLVKCGE